MMHYLSGLLDYDTIISTLKWELGCMPGTRRGEYTYQELDIIVFSGMIIIFHNNIIRYNGRVPSKQYIVELINTLGNAKAS